MRIRTFFSMAALLAGTSLGLGEAPAPSVAKSSVEVTRTAAPAGLGSNAASPKAATAGEIVANGTANSVVVSDEACGCHQGCGLLHGLFGGARGGDYMGNRYWVSAEYLIWWTQDGDTPTLIGSAPASALGASPQELSDQIAVVFGGKNAIDYDEHSGVRFTAGMWLDDNDQYAAEISLFKLEDRGFGFFAASAGSPLLGPVFFDPAEDPLVLVLNSVPGFRSGSVSIQAHDRLWGMEANLLRTFFREHLRFLVGIRHLRYDESIEITSTSTLLTGAASDTEIDRFSTRNHFFGPQVGFDAMIDKGPWVLNVRGKLAFGNMHEEVEVDGFTTVTTPAGSATVFGGIFAQQTNIGTRDRNEFAIIPEITANLGYRVTENLTAFIGYNGLRINRIARPGEQIDFNVQSTAVPIVADFDPAAPNQFPRPRLKADPFWAQGLNFGLELRF